MYTAGLNPFYASNFSLWSAYCAGGFAVDAMKKPSFCIADILQQQAGGDADGAPGSSSAHMGQQHRVQAAHPGGGGSPLRPSPVVAPEGSVFGARAPYHHHHHHRHGLHITRTFNSQQAAPLTSSKDLKFGIDRILSTDFDPKGKETSSLRDLTSIVSSHRQSGIHLSVQPPVSQYFSSLDHHAGMSDAASAMMSSLAGNSHGRHTGPHPFQDTFPGPYAVLTKDTMPQTYKRKRSWSRAVFSNLQRKGLEKRFEIQKYVTKPDRKQLAAMLGLTDAQVKVWFQNRRMKWRHSKEAQAQKDKEKDQPEDSNNSTSNNNNNNNNNSNNNNNNSTNKSSTAGAAEEGEEPSSNNNNKEPDESECESDACSESGEEFDEAMMMMEDKSDVDICEHHNKTSVIMNPAVSNTEDVTDTGLTAPSAAQIVI